MKILEISLFYYPDKTGIAVTSTEVAEWFAEHGNDVTVITSPPFYPNWKIDEKYKKIKKEKINKVNVLRTKLFVPSKISTIGRLFHELSFSFFVFFKALFLSKPDVIILVSPPLSTGFVAIFLKIIWRRKLLLNVKDLVPDAAIELNMLGNPIVIKLMYWLEKVVYKYSDRIASLGHGVLGRIQDKGVAACKLFYLPDTADPILLNAERKERKFNPFIINNNIDSNTFIVLHSGNMGVKQGIDVIVKAAKLIDNPQIKFFIVGDGVVKSEILNMIKKLKLKNVVILPLQPREILADMYHAADISLLTQKAEVVDIVVPSKLISMMAAGSCVIASADQKSEGAEIIKKANCGIVVEPEDPLKLAEAILRYFDKPGIIEKCKNNSKKFISSNYDRDKIMKNYLDILIHMSSKGENL